MLAGILGSVTSFGSGIFLVVVYAFFLGAERRSLADKLAAALPRGDQERTARLIHDINSRIGDYLAIKSLIKVILGMVSYLIMLFMGLDFAAFWAVLIALGNYIPYVGTLAVLFPIVFSLAQFGSLATTLILAALLSLAQIVSDNMLEPKMLAKQLNLGPL
jgi:AI-2 transport protein TqsA